MMDVDRTIQFAADVAFPGTTAYLAGSTVDLIKSGLDIGDGEDIWLWIQTGSTALTGTTTAFSLDLLTSDTNPTTTWSSPTTHITGDVFANVAGSPTAGAAYALWKAISLPKGLYKRYMGLRFNFATAALSTGTLIAFLTQKPYGWRSLPQSKIAV